MFSNGRIVTGTPDHPIFADGNWVELGHLREYHQATTDHCIATFGNQSTAVFPVAIISTTRTAIGITTSHRILSASRQRITENFMARRRNSKARCEDGIVKMVQDCKRRHRQLFNGVNNAVADSSREVSRLILQDEGVPVYDISVEGAHEFFANGILVHNCTREGTGSRTAGVLLGGIGSEFIVADVKIGRWSSSDREKIILQTAQLDRQRFGSVTTWVEQEPGSGGKESAEATIRNLAGYTIKAERVTGDKVSRAEPLACQASVGNVQLLRGDWNAEFIDELEAFPASALKDQVDAASGAFNKLALTNPLTAASQLMTGPLRPRTFAPRSLLNRGAIH